jgi:hypothetical protein
VLKLKSPQLTRTSFNRSNLYLEVKSKGGPWYDLSLLLAPGCCFVVVFNSLSPFSGFILCGGQGYPVKEGDVMFCSVYKVVVLCFAPEIFNYRTNLLGRKWCQKNRRFFVDRQLDIKGSLTRDFRLQVFFINQCPPGH